MSQPDSFVKAAVYAAKTADVEKGRALKHNQTCSLHTREPTAYRSGPASAIWDCSRDLQGGRVELLCVLHIVCYASSGKLDYQQIVQLVIEGLKDSKKNPALTLQTVLGKRTGIATDSERLVELLLR